MALELVLSLRILAVGTERALLKRLGSGEAGAESTFLFFSTACLFLWPLASPPTEGWRFLLFAVPSGVLLAGAFVLYVRSLSYGEISLVSPLAGASYLFLLLLASLVHDERVTWLRLSGVLIILWGTATLDGGRVDLRRLWSDRPCRDMLGYAFLLAVGRVLDKHASAVVPPTLYAAVMFSTITVVLGLYLAQRGRLGNAVGLLRRRPWQAFLAGLTNAVAYGAMIVLMRSLPLSVIEPLTGLSLLVTALLGRLWFGEPVRRRLWPSLLIMLGSWLVLQ